MKQLLIILLCCTTTCYAQQVSIAGAFGNDMSSMQVSFNADSTFLYTSKEQHPTFNRWEPFSEKGQWIQSGDTIILNPTLSKKPFIETTFEEGTDATDNSLLLTFNHIKRYFDSNGNIIKTDTLQIQQLDYAFNDFNRKKRSRIAKRPSTRCAFAGYIPKETITASHTISIQKTDAVIKQVFFGCYELMGTKAFTVTNTNANHFTLNVFSNYYQDGQLRQVKVLIKNSNTLYTRQKENGRFVKDNLWSEADSKLKKQKTGS
jgi:hypothetical protein